ncbi:MAG: choice-of-anchor J domain-containing protein [Bacteroidales bacterium]|nr:choice-of-anchor J domain-containing protein [Bacteroidales bacterium]
MKKLFLTTIIFLLGLFSLNAQSPVADVKATINENSNVDLIWSWNKIVPESIIVDFETGNLSQADFNNDGNAPWVITEDAYEGNYAIKSSCEGVNDGKSVIEITVDVPFDGKMSFYHKSSCEQFFDNGKFYIDGVQKAVATGITDWSYREYTVKKGVHTYKWEYSKDVADAAGLDAYFVDNIVLYKPIPPFEGGWIHYDEGEYANAVGSETGAVYWGISFPETTEYEGYSLTKLAYYDKNAGDITAKIFFGGETAPETLVHEQNFTVSGSDQVVELELDTPVAIDGTQPLWITFYSTSSFPATACYHVGDSNSDWLSFNGTSWGHTPDYGIIYTWIIRGYLENAKGEMISLGQQTTDNGQQSGLRDFVGSYNVFRTNVHTEEVVSVAENVSDTTLTDNGWNALEMGAYKWGVSAIYNNNEESEITWSNTLDKDMFTSLEFVVETNSGNSSEGTKISFRNLKEPDAGYDYKVKIDASGKYIWDSFRKGEYSYSVILKGYDTLNVDYVEIWDATTLTATLTEILAPVENLFVSATGWAMWENKDFSNGGGEFSFNFDDGSMEGWQTIDADGDGFNWRITTDIMGPGYGHDGSRYCVISQSFDNDSLGPLTPDNYLVTSDKYLIKDGSQLSFYVCAQDATYSAEHYAVAISTTGNTNPEDFTIIFEETLTAKGDAKPQGAWYQKKIDLSSYAEQEIYIAFRHFNCTDQFYIDLDDIVLVNESKSKDNSPISYDIYLDEVFEATVTTNYYQHQNLDSEEFLESGPYHVTKIVANYATGDSESVQCPWMFSPCDMFEQATDLTGENFFGKTVLNWSLPGQEDIEANDSFSFDFEDGTLDGWTTIDADGDMLGWRNSAGYMEPGYGNNGSQNYAMSESFNNSFGGALTPDNYLVTSEKYLIKEGTQLSFYVCAQDENYPYEHYGIALSVAGNGSAEDFVTVWEETITSDGKEERQTKWTKRTINLGDYAGREMYIAFRHFNCTDQYILNIDDVTLTSGEKGNRYGEVLGVMVFRGDELLTPEPIFANSFVEEFPSNVEEEYCIRVVYQHYPDSEEMLPGDGYWHYAMACEQYVTVGPVDVKEVSKENMNIYPNPTDGIINVEADGMEHIAILNTLGQIVYERDANNDKETIDISRYESGVYMLRMTTENGIVVRRILKL